MAQPTKSSWSKQCGLPLYSLIELLDRDARLMAVTIRLESNKELEAGPVKAVLKLAGKAIRQLGEVHHINNPSQEVNCKLSN